jgi:alpha-tubulin suppressor-like RCC1 family protein
LGNNTYGQLGWIYVQIYNDVFMTNQTNYYLRKNEKAISVACGGSHTVVLSNSNNLYACGNNSKGQVGMNNQVISKYSYLLPMFLTNFNLEKIISIACGWEHTVVLTNTGNLYACGDNTYGQLGMNNTTNLSILTPMVLDNLTTNRDKTISISCGRQHTVVLTVSGNLYACGDNTYGQLGDNTIVQKTTLVKMSDPSGGYVVTEMPRYVACGGYHTVVLTNNNNLYACGYNFDGQLGIVSYGTENPYNTLQKMLSPSLSSGEKFISIACGNYHTVVLTNKNNIYGCGYNFLNQLGQDSQGSSITTLSKFSSQYGSAGQGETSINLSTGENFISVTCGNNHTIVLTNKGRIYGCGNNSKGQLSSKVENNKVVANNINTSNTYTTLTTNLFVISVDNTYKSMMGLPFLNGVSIQATSGWNMIGSLENARIFDQNGIIFSNTVQTFINGYGYIPAKNAKNNTDISGNYGYWLKCIQPGTITLNYL